MKLLGKFVVGAAALCVPCLIGASVALEVGQATHDQKLTEHERRLEALEKLPDQLHAMDVDVQVLVRDRGLKPAPRP